MNSETYHLEIITPCFCAGADQSKAEIRPPSIRGQLRWWFRVLGGNANDEAIIFGSVAGDEGCTSSALLVRVGDFKSGPPWQPPTINQNKPENYVWHFASVSGTTVKGATGPRWASSAVVSPRSTFTLHLVWRRAVPAEQKSLFDLALHAFLCLGALGLRGTRGLGAFLCHEARSLEEQLAELERKGVVVRQRNNPGSFDDYESALSDYSKWLRYDFRKKFKANRPSPLGASAPRQASAIRFRPIRLASGQFTWVVFEAPHGRVLRRESRTPQPVLRDYSLSGPAPSPPAPKRH